MANTKNSQAAKIRKQIIAWLQDEDKIEVVSEQRFPGIRGIRAVQLRQMLGEQGYPQTAVMGAVSAAPSIDHRIQKAALKPREVYYYFVADADVKPAKDHPATGPVAKSARPARPGVGLTATPAFTALHTANDQLDQAVDDLLTAAQSQAPLSDLEIDFLTDLATQTAKQSELLQKFATQERIAQLRHH
ncbi:hypothetical protein [Levilactobacillus acidifarinae]|uniref:Uncharacterized protein n=1 Tax=Levilactobacillus acidifarinae DSM 19394 = JCM 15949 TaxID=1423715 RepID=A0A0R1LS57_9LACO|nr:hypothetical protein [Levilactobacillus acidifarinae]KRK94962.1 hypothetical protein FD25_GL002147 [Levilactobacillus acidifarinae DSM 19394]GEO70110.1 hypothetical protein LAC03_20200 [Levilactobacillus acidifarinae]